MPKLFYNVYSNITDREYLKIEKKLNLLQYKMSKILFPHNWQLISQAEKKDGLYAGFRKSEKVLEGSIGLAFEDEPGGLTFIFGVAKSFDESHYRYILQKAICKNQKIEFIENNIEELTKQVLETYNGWSKDDILNLGEKIE